MHVQLHISVCVIHLQSINVRFFLYRQHTVLGWIVIFCICGVVLHVHPSLNWQLGDIINIKFSDINVVMIMAFMSIVCTRSCLQQLRAKPADQTFRTLFYNSLFGQESQVFKSPFPILIVISLPTSLCYLVTMVTYIYYNWEIELPQFFHPLQIYPASLIVLQSLFQGKCFVEMQMHNKRQSLFHHS